jgi:hypothetical protein
VKSQGSKKRPPSAPSTHSAPLAARIHDESRFAPERHALTAIPWTKILGDGERPLAKQSHGNGQGLVVLLGSLDALILDLPDQGPTTPERLEAMPDQLDLV